MSLLEERLIGNTIEALYFEHERYVIRFANSSGITIVNFKGDYDAPNNLGATVVDVTTSNDEIAIKLDTGNELIISLHDNDYVGPEAFLFSDPKTGRTIVG